MERFLVTSEGGFIGSHLASISINKDTSSEFLDWKPKVSLENRIAITYKWIEGQVRKDGVELLTCSRHAKDQRSNTI